ncbi:MAG: prepilin-type N-terminal cleavage/methylation domain-containing protein [Candidatus Melainabacteria bacterium]|nr:prepilin-type N-terminal cleavage/methylation domain-containing protein [Candidatus Melainabacteria bacterium]
MKRKKRALTLLEIMIVIVLIGIIGSVIGFNMKGSLDEGRAFKSRQAKEQITDILMLEVARGMPIDEVITKREQVLANSGLVKKPKDFLKDGWGVEFEVKPYGKSSERIIVSSAKLKAYEAKKNQNLGKAETDATESEDE